jgi:hypothetical protein
MHPHIYTTAEAVAVGFINQQTFAAKLKAADESGKSQAQSQSG